MQRFFKRLEQELTRLDVVIINAGIVLDEYIVQPEGFEETNIIQEPEHKFRQTLQSGFIEWNYILWEVRRIVCREI